MLFSVNMREDRYSGNPPVLEDVPVLSPIGFRLISFINPDDSRLSLKIWSSEHNSAGNGFYPYPDQDNQETYTRGSIWEYAQRQALKNNVSPVWAEFGVAMGISARYWLTALPEDGKLYLFDSFEGLPEAWRHLPAGHFKTEVPTFNDSRAIIKRGWFEATLPLDDLLGFVHIDSDLYSSAKIVLENINVTKGTIILFDELFGYEGWEEDEYRALMEWDVPFKFIARDMMTRAAIEIL
jgi:hypothetical protein